MVTELPINATTSAVSSFTSIIGETPSWFSLFVMVSLAVMVVSVFAMVLSSVANYMKVRVWVKKLLGTVAYFVLGLISLVVIAIPLFLLYYFIIQAQEGNVVPLWVTGSIIAGYIIIAGLGYIVKKYVIDRIVAYEEQYRKEHPEEFVDEEGESKGELNGN